MDTCSNEFRTLIQNVLWCRGLVKFWPIQCCYSMLCRFYSFLRMEDKCKKDGTGYTCEMCKRTLSTKGHLQVHYKTHVDKNLRDTFPCSYCGKRIFSERNLTRHLSICDKNNLNNSKAQVHRKVKCAMCPYEDSQIDVLTHYNQQHDIVIVTECITFNSFDEFEKWKDETEKTTISKYIRYDARKSSTKTHYYYRCHRDGFHKNHGKNIRHLKIKGSNKINGFCPSKLNVTVENGNGHVSVKFVKTHVGHQMDLGKIPLSKSERNNLASKLSLKIPFDEILNSVRDNVEENTVERIHLLTRQDLYNIRQLHNNNTEKPSNDCVVSVQAWIKEMQENSCDSVIRFYKEQGEDNESEYSELQKEDFLLIIMNDAQMEILKKYGNECICIDSTHGLDGYNVELTTLMALDDSRQGFPCLFTFSNRSDTVIFTIIFKVLKNILDFPLTPSVFMSDTAEIFYNAWSNVMGPVDFRLFSSWHVLRACKNIYSKIENTDKQSSVHNILRTLLEELDESAFEEMLENFIHSTETDVELKEIGKYLKTNYYLKRKSWAYCYRNHAGLNTNMHLERMHHTLQSIYFKAKTVKRLDRAINAIMTLVRDKLYGSLIIDLHKGKVSTKLSALRNRHLNIEQQKNKPVIEKQEGNWILSSATGRELCKIQIAKPKCKCEVKCIKCDTCIHSYKCSCPDSSVNWNMCKHIHLLCESGLTNARPNDLISEDDNVYPHCDMTVAEKDIEFIQLTSTVSAKKPNSCDIDKINKYKDKISKQFQLILRLPTTMEQCSVIEKTLTSLVTELAAMESP